MEELIVVKEILEKLTAPLIEAVDCDLVLLTYQREMNGLVLRIMVEKKGSDPFKSSGVDHQLLSCLSRQISDAIDGLERLQDEKFFLEVSSPGIERPLVRADDYQRFAGRRVNLTTGRPILNNKKFKGKLRGLVSQSVQLLLDSGETIEIPLDAIKKANLVFIPGEAELSTGER